MQVSLASIMPELNVTGSMEELQNRIKNLEGRVDQLGKAQAEVHKRLQIVAEALTVLGNTQQDLKIGQQTVRQLASTLKSSLK